MRASGLASLASVDAAVATSILARMPPTARHRLLSAATQVRLPSRTYFVHAGDAPRCGVVLKGMVRVTLVTADGRDLTLNWEAPGGIVGLTWIVRTPAPCAIQAVSDAIILELPVQLLRDLALADPKVGWAIMEFTESLLHRAVDEIALYAYGDLRTRIERRLLEFGCKRPPGTPFIAQLTQDELAHAVGAARPSVARVLKELRDEGAIRSLHGGVLILRPEALARARRPEVA